MFRWTPIIQDSTLLLRSLAHHVAAGNDKLAQAFAALLPGHPAPALTFACRPSREARLHRLEGRIARGNDAAEDLIVRDDPVRFACMKACLNEQAMSHFGAELLDTSCLEDSLARNELVTRLVERLRGAHVNRQG